MYKTIFFSFLFLSLFSECIAQNPENILLKNYRPKSIYKVPVTKITKAKFPVVDMHAHPRQMKNEEDIKNMIRRMDKLGIAKTVLLAQKTGPSFDSICRVYAPYSDRFEVWCGFDYTGYNEPGWSEKAVKELERCVKAGARGVGELGDKGYGEMFSEPTIAYGMHIDDPRMKPLFQKCGELKIPVNVHVADPMWMYEPMDSTNDGLMNAYYWRIDSTKKGLLGHAALIKTLENVVRDNPNTIFIASHLANCEYDMSILGNLFTKYKNLYADLSARIAEIAPIPRYMHNFFEKFQDRLVYGTDMKMDEYMYETTFRVLQTNDEHFYAIDLYYYHWPLYGLGLSDATLKKIYKTNADKILKK